MQETRLIRRKETDDRDHMAGPVQEQGSQLEPDPRGSLMSDPLVSITIPTLNSAKTLSKCLDSIHNQTHRNTEIIIVDGGSKDETVKIARSAGTQVYFGNDLAERRLLGVRVSRGQYVVLLDSDQVLDPAAIETCCKACNDDGWDALVLAETPIFVGSRVQKAIALDRFLVHHYTSSHPIFGTGLARFFNRDFLCKISWPEHVNANDHAWIQYAVWKAGGKIGTTNALILHHDPKTLAEYSKKFYRWGYHYTSELGTNPAVTVTHALPRRVYVSKLALENPLFFELAFLYLTKVISAGLGGSKYVFERLWSKIKRTSAKRKMLSPTKSEPNR